MKYRLTDETKEWCGRTLHRIEALKSFGNISAGEKGGWIEKEENLSQEGSCWVYGDAQVYGNAQVCGDAQVYGNARVYGDAQVKSVEDIFCIAGLGSRYGTTTIYRNDGGITVVCGCFLGTLEEFEAKVKETHGGNLYGREYLKLIELAKLHFEVEG